MYPFYSYFFFDAIINRTVLLISFSDRSLLKYKNTDFCLLILYPALLGQFYSTSKNIFLERVLARKGDLAGLFQELMRAKVPQS